MRLLKILVALLLVLGLAILLSENSSQNVTIWLYPGTVISDINLAMALVSTLIIGILVGFIIGLVQIITQRREIVQKNRQLKNLRTELNDLRHSGLEEDLFKEDAGGTSEMEDSPSTTGRQLLQLGK